MKSFAMLAAIGLLLNAGIASAEIYKKVDEKGRVTYSNVPEKGAKKVDLQPLSVVPSTKPPEPARASEEDRPQTDDAALAARRRELQDKIAAEEQLVQQARQALKEGEAVRLGNERNYQKYLDRVQGLKDNVAQHEKNLEILKNELAGLK
jgi:hypothetical protein